MMRSPLALALMVALVAAAPAVAENRVLKCKTSAARGAPPSGGPALVANVPRSMTPIELSAVQFTDKKLGKTVIVEELAALRNQTNGLTVIARFVNCTKKPMVIQARSNFLDGNQLPTENASSWRTIFLSPLSTGVYQENSIATAKVAAFYVELRPNL
jgi:hypothetical protein